MNYNDLMTKGITPAAPGAAIVTGPCRVKGISVTSATNALGGIRLYNATATGGSPVLTFRAATGTTLTVLIPDGGIRFDVGLSSSALIGSETQVEVLYIAE